MNEFYNGQEVKYKGNDFYRFLYVGRDPKNGDLSIVCDKDFDYMGCITVYTSKIEAV